VSQTEPAPEPVHDISWLRAIATGVAVLVIGIGATVIGANRILTKALGVTRGGREALASGLFLVVIVVLAWALRRLQSRGMI
jgi:hypothetical protein